MQKDLEDQKRNVLPIKNWFTRNGWFLETVIASSCSWTTWGHCFQNSARKIPINQITNGKTRTNVNSGAPRVQFRWVYLPQGRIYQKAKRDFRVLPMSCTKLTPTHAIDGHPPYPWSSSDFISAAKKWYKEICSPHPIEVELLLCGRSN